MGEQFEKALSLSQLRKAVKLCRRNVMWKDSVAGFNNKSLLRCKKLRDDVLNGSYSISRYIQFKVHEPKERTILATRMRDRVFQRSLCDNGVYGDMTRGFIYDNGACMFGRGTDHAVKRMKCFLQKFYRETGGNAGYAVHMDVRHYFPDTPHSAAKEAVENRIRDSRTTPYILNIIDSYEDRRSVGEIIADPFGPRGVGLGSQMSQLIQLALLDKVDHGLKEKYGLHWYIRYMDDFLIVCDTREKLKAAMQFITEELAKLGLVVISKGGIYQLRQGVNFLKLRFILTEEGKVLLRMSHKALARERRQLKNMKQLLADGRVTMGDVRTHYQCWIAHAKRANAEGVIRDMDKFYTTLFRALPNYTYKGHKYKRGRRHVSNFKKTAPRDSEGE